MTVRELKGITAALGDELDFLEVVLEQPAPDWKHEDAARLGTPARFRVHSGAYVALEVRG